MTDAWERHAAWWQATFTGGADPEYTEQIIPLVAELLAGARRVVDLGAGEGQLARVLADQGAEVVGVDRSRAQVIEARARGGGPVYVRADAHVLPMPDGSFDAALACLVFEHLDDLDDAVSEVGRVLGPRGRFLLMLNHPLLQTPGSGWIDDQILDPPEQYWRIGPYLPEDRSRQEVAKGVELPFVHRPLSRYVNALAAVGLRVARMEEPPPPPGFVARAPEYGAAETIPRLLVLDTRREGA